MPGDKHAAIRTRRQHQALLDRAEPTVRSADERDALRAGIVAEFTADLDRALADLREGHQLLTTWNFHQLDEWARFCDTTVDRQSPAALAWRRAVLDRDGHACTACGATTGLHAHHIEEWATHPELRYEPANGRTLCGSCHRDEHRRG